jgi:hypothetical protein
MPGFEQAGVDPSNALEVRGECALAAGQAARAVESARSSIAACEQSSPTSPECPSKYWLQARALDALGKRREAIAAATQAEQRASKGELAPRIDRNVIRAWIAARRR